MARLRRKKAHGELRLVHPTQCGAKTADGSPCERETGGEPCWQHREDPVDPPPPEHLGEYGREEWARRVNQFTGLGIMGQVDLGLLESACEHYEEARRCQRALKEHGHVVRGRSGVKKNPASAKHISYRKEYRICLVNLLNLAREALPDTKKDEFDPIAEIGGY